MNGRAIRVLLVDDDEDYFVLTRSLLGDIQDEAYDLDWMATYAAALAAMARNDHDLCLLDYDLGEHTGLELLEAALAAGCASPIIMLTGQGDHRLDLEAMKAGAADYLAKGKTDAALLERSMRYALERTRTLQALRQNEQHIADLYRKEQDRSHELERAYADLRRVEGMRDDLMHMIVHDLRNPLSVIIANLDLLGKAVKDPASGNLVARMLKSARAASNLMMEMMDDLLHLNKLEAGAMRLALAPVHLPSLLADKELGYQTQAERDERMLTVRAPAELPHVMADADLIGRVIDNLVNNAFKYTEANGHVEIAAEACNGAVVVHIRDDGFGIPAEHQATIFDKYVQVTDANGLPLHKGIGIGLTFCRLAVEAHGGKIWVESAPGQGSTFSFTLPLQH